MKTLDEIVQILSEEITEVADSIDIGDYHVIICPERIFIADYLKPAEEDLLRKSNNMDDDIDNPLDVPYQHTVFIVLKFMNGNTNGSVLTQPVQIMCLSEEDDYKVANSILRKYCEKYNFEYRNGMVAKFMMPSVVQSSSDVYEGFRAQLSCSGELKIVEDGLVFVTEAWWFNDQKEKWVRLPFIMMADAWTASYDPQSFAGFQGRTMNLNRQSTSTITVSTYLWDTSSDGVGEFSRNVLNSDTEMNRKYRLCFLTNIMAQSVPTGDNADMIKQLWKDRAESEGVEYSEKDIGYLPISIKDYTIISRQYQQGWGDVSAWSLSFSESISADKERFV